MLEAVDTPLPSFGVFVGPEGDFTPEELRALLEIATPVSFGPTILRAETAAVFGLSVLAAARASRSDYLRMSIVPLGRSTR